MRREREREIIIQDKKRKQHLNYKFDNYIFLLIYALNILFKAQK